MNKKINKLSIKLDSGKIIILTTEEYLDLCKKIEKLKTHHMDINDFARINVNDDINDVKKLYG